MVDYGPSDATTLRSLQLERLRSTLIHAHANSAHYRGAFDAAGIGPEDVHSLADLARCPLTTKADFRRHYPFGMFAVPQARIARLHASSGTTGQPTVVGYTAEDLQVWSSLVARSLHAAGVRPGMKVHIAYGYGLFTGGLGAHYGAEALGCTVIPMSGGQTEKQVRLIQDFKPEVIMVTPSYMLALLDEFHRQGIDPRASSLRIGIFGAEPWTNAARQEIEAAFALQATDIYGLSEVMGPGVAQEFAGDDAPTIWEDHFYPEIIDPLTGDPVPDGEEGELVLTTLSKEALPVIRYRTRDLTRLLPGTRSPMRRMAKIIGRSDDMLIVRGVNVFPSQVEECILQIASLSPHFELEISRSDRMDQVRVIVEARRAIDPSSYNFDAGALARSIKDLTGVTMSVDIVTPDTLLRSAGKAARVRDLRQ